MMPILQHFTSPLLLPILLLISIPVDGLSFSPPPFLTAQTSNPPQPKTTTPKTIQETSSRLLTLVLDRWEGKNAPASTFAEIDNLSKKLIDSKVRFDPSQCLTNSFYATVYTTGSSNPPLWEVLGRLSGDGEDRRRNIQGQWYRPDGEVINYSEVLGTAFHLRAYGTFERISSTVPASSSNQNDNVEKLEEPDKEKNPFFPMGKIFSMFSSPPSTTSNLVTCPADWTATVQRAEFRLFKNQKVALPIKGAGTARLLYADPDLRIFVSVKDTIGKVKWEEEGLLAIQVRIDLVVDDWSDFCL